MGWNDRWHYSTNSDPGSNHCKMEMGGRGKNLTGNARLYTVLACVLLLTKCT